MKKITYLIILLFALNFGYGQTTLAEGDIAITGVNTSNADQFSFVLLADVVSGTTIYFADKSWLSTGGWRINGAGNTNAEGILTWQATANLSCGTEIIITDIGSNNYSTLDFSGNSIGIVTESEAGFALARDGDQVIAYQGSLTSPVFLYAVQIANNNGWTDATNNSNSAVPAGLTDGINAMTFNQDNSIFDRSVMTNQTLILNAVSDAANWIGSENPTRQILGGTGVYSCAAPSSCLSTVTWNGSWSGAPDLTTNVIIAANYNTNASIGSFKACSLTVNAGSTLTIDNSTYIEIENDATINGDLIVETQGNFVQNDNASSFTVGATGSTLVNKQTPIKADWFYYTYWSSPVANETIGNVFPDVDGDRCFWFNAANFVDNVGSDDIDDNGDDWQYALAGNAMTPGVGYAVTEAKLFFPGATGQAIFEGPFNTGNIDTNISLNVTNTGTNWNFIGNPYPSAIDFIAFQFANSSVVDGAAYFWSQSLPPDNANPGNEVSNFNQNDYATFTVGTGGAAGASGITPNQFIPSGQGFFIAGLASGTATFTNAMRMADATSNNQFFKNANSKKNSSNIANKLWVDLTSDNGVFNQILVGYVDGATNLNDGRSYDAQRLLTADFSAALYSSIEYSNEKFAIQGKAPESLTEDEIINIGFSTNINVATIYKLSIAQFEGNFLTNNPVYVKDNLLDTLHDLSASDYTFTSEVGEFNDRFEIRFSANVLATERVEANSNDLKIIELEDDNIQFITSKNIKTVKIFDLMGRQLYQFEGNQTSETYKLSNLSSSIYIAKVTLINDATITKKAFKK